MNVNQELNRLEEVTNLPVSPDIYDGNEDNYITYVYTDERPTHWGDDQVLADMTTVQVNLFTVPKKNHMTLKHTIRDYLETLGEVNDISSWLETYTTSKNVEKIVRRTTFNVTITKER